MSSVKNDVVVVRDGRATTDSIDHFSIGSWENHLRVPRTTIGGHQPLLFHQSYACSIAYVQSGARFIFVPDFS